MKVQNIHGFKGNAIKVVQKVYTLKINTVIVEKV